MTTNGTTMVVDVARGPGVARVEAHAAVRADLSIRFTAEQELIILETCCGGASKSEAHALISIAEARGLNPILGECYFVKRWDSAANTSKWAVQAAIDSFRIKAEQTGLYAGQDEPEYEYDAHGNVTLARVRVYRKDWTRPSVGVARYEEYVQTTKAGDPTKFWKQMPHNQLAKCAEALALRKAFPAVLSKIYSTDEMGQADNEAPPPPRIAAPARAALPAPVDGALSELRDRTFAKLCERVDAGENAPALNGVASAASKARKAGHLTEEQFAKIAQAVTTKRGLVGAPVPPASAPDQDPNNGAEIDETPEREPGEEG